MKAFAKVIAGLSLFGASLLLPPRSGAESLGAMRIGLVHGDAQVKIADTGEWVPASVNMPLVEGDELWVPEESRAEIQTNNGAWVRLGADTALQILRTDRDSFQFHLQQGRAYALSRARKRSLLQFDTPDASIRAFGKATFQVDALDGGTDVSALRGAVRAESEAGTTRVRAGEMLALAPDGYAELSPLPPPDEWRNWNARRDRIVLARGRSRDHLPPDLWAYSSDFDEHGRWVQVPDYGYCWAPTALVVADWAPYRHGRWVWRGGDYVWIGYEPWGWAPYHYGRWAFVVRVGWVWVPPPRGHVYWAPGYVGWVRRGDYVAWVPLAPGEIYYGHGHYGPQSVNVTQVDVNVIRVTNVYRNVNVANSVTVVNHTTFVTGRPSHVDRDVVVQVRDDFAKRRNIVVGRPAIRPVAESYRPVDRSVPEARRPPARVRTIDAKEIRQARPLVREPDRSALRPQAPPRPLEVRKVDRPSPASERARGRERLRPAERSGPEAPRGGPPERMERSRRPREADAPERRRRDAPPGSPAERERMERGGGPPVEAVPQERRRREAPPGPPAERERIERREGPRQGMPPERVEPETGRGGSDVREERGGRPTEVAPRERERRELRERAPGRPPTTDRTIDREKPQAAPVEKVAPEGPGRSVGERRPQAVPQERGRPERPSRPDQGIEKGRPPEAPAERVKPEQPRGETGRGVEKERPKGSRAREGRLEPAADNVKGRGERGKKERPPLDEEREERR